VPEDIGSSRPPPRAAIHSYWKNALQLAHLREFIDEHGSLDDF
jgi:hypothetical protein